jgi:hypothetical protein
MNLDKETVTLIAACIAASTSILSVMIGLLANRASEFRAAHRKTIEPVIYELSESIYGFIAICVKMVKVKSPDRLQEYLDLAKVERDKLERLRRKIRYVLFGLDEAIQLIAGSAVHLTHIANNEEELSGYISELTDLRKIIDEIIRLSYAKGKPPSKRQIQILNRQVYVCKRMF